MCVYIYIITSAQVNKTVFEVRNNNGSQYFFILGRGEGGRGKGEGGGRRGREEGEGRGPFSFLFVFALHVISRDLELEN